MEESKLKENKKSNVGLIVFLIILVLGLVGYICYDKFIAVNNNLRCAKETCNCSNKKSSSTESVSVRVYRFFGYEEGSSPDMYTTLKLYSDGNYEFYINQCEGAGKYTGKYTETDSKISLSGDYENDLKKIDNGNSLDYDGEDSCNGPTGGSFSLESYMLN